MKQKVCQRGHVRADDGRDHCIVCKRERARRNGYYVPVGSVPDSRVNPDAIESLDVRAEWEHFAGFGWSDERIAERLGLNLASLRTATRRRQYRQRVSA